METNEIVSEASTVVEESPSADSSQHIVCLIHVRFAPNGAVTEIGERPSAVDKQIWFNFLSRHTHNCYQALSGGRGLFRLPRSEVEILKTTCIGEQST